jgi:hypothetical protein
MTVAASPTQSKQADVKQIKKGLARICLVVERLRFVVEHKRILVGRTSYIEGRMISRTLSQDSYLGLQHSIFARDRQSSRTNAVLHNSLSQELAPTKEAMMTKSTSM